MLIRRTKRWVRGVLPLLLGLPLMAADAPGSRETDRPTPRADNKGWMDHHERNVALAKKGNIDLYFEGDSITDGWTWAGRRPWQKTFGGWNAGNFGIGGDQTQHVLWRLENGELEGVSPKVFVLMIGTNNMGASGEDVVAGGTAVVNTLKEKRPEAKILLLAIFPRKEKADDPVRLKLGEVNKQLALLDDGKRVKFLDIGHVFLEPDGTLPKAMFPDFLHPNEEGYVLWAEAIKPTLTEWLGAPAATMPAATNP